MFLTAYISSVMAHQHSVLANYDKLSFRFSETVVIVTARLFVHWLVMCVAASVFIKKKSGICFIIAALHCLTFNELHLLVVYTISHY